MLKITDWTVAFCSIAMQWECSINISLLIIITNKDINEWID